MDLTREEIAGFIFHDHNRVAMCKIIPISVILATAKCYGLTFETKPCHQISRSHFFERKQALHFPDS